MPPLSDRREDIPELARHFVARFAAEEGKRVSRISADAMALLTAHHWPGNVRQLENAAFRAVVLADGDEIGIAEFPQIAAQAGATRALPAEASPDIAPTDVRFDHGMPADMRPMHGPSSVPTAAPALSLSLLDPQGEVRPLQEMETEVIRFAITIYRGQMSEVARRLQIGRSTLYRKLEALGLASSPGNGAKAGPVVRG